MNGERRLAVGREEARLLTELERNNIAVYSGERHRALLPEFTDLQLRKLAYQLAKKGWLIRIEAGKYVVVPRAARGTWHEDPLVIASVVAPDPHYVSYWSALAYHDLTEQLPQIVYVGVCGKRKRPLEFQRWHYRFIHREADAFYGFQQQELGALNGAALVGVPIATPEKALLDSLDDELLAGGMGEIVKALWRGLDSKTFDLARLLDYAVRYPNAAVLARLGFLLERFGVDEARHLLPLVRKRGTPPALATKLKSGAATQLDRRWYLRNNLPEAVFDAGMVT